MAHLWRLGRWAGWRMTAEPLVAILHLGHLFAPPGFLLAGLSALAPAVAPASAGIHAWTAGLIGTMTLAVMTRAGLGHTRRPLAASPAVTAVYAAVVAAATPALCGLLWSAAFAGSALALGGALTSRPPQVPE